MGNNGACTVKYINACVLAEMYAFNYRLKLFNAHAEEYHCVNAFVGVAVFPYGRGSNKADFAAGFSDNRVGKVCISRLRFLEPFTVAVIISVVPGNTRVFINNIAYKITVLVYFILYDFELNMFT